MIDWRRTRVPSALPRQRCPACGLNTLVLRTVAASRIGDFARKVRKVNRVECEAGCDLTDSQMRGAGVAGLSDRRRPVDDPAPSWQETLGEDRCDVADPTVTGVSCPLRVGHGGAHHYPL